ncbi:MAG: ABC transporter permease [Planctomycetota bacterium]
MSAALAPIRWLGSTAINTVRGLAEVFSLLYGALAVLVYVRTAGFGTVLKLGVTQTVFTGVHALPLVSLAALALGTLIITAVNAYPIDAATIAAQIIVLEVIPLVVALIILGRSGTAICVELASMKLSGELDALRSMGIPLEHVIVLPRLIAGVVSALTLTIYGAAVGLGGGYFLAKALPNRTLPFALEAMVNAIREEDVFKVLVKVCLFGGGIVLVSIRDAYSVQSSRREIPIAATNAVVHSMALVFVLNSLISIFV